MTQFLDFHFIGVSPTTHIKYYSNFNKIALFKPSPCIRNTRMKCPQCSFDNKSDKKFCTKYGSKIASKSPNCDTDLNPETLITEPLNGCRFSFLSMYVMAEITAPWGSGSTQNRPTVGISVQTNCMQKRQNIN